MSRLALSSRSLGWIALLVLLFHGVGGSPLAAHPLDDLIADGVGFEEVVDPADSLFERIAKGTSADRAAPGRSFLDWVFRLEHDVPIGGGRTLRVIESFTLRAWLQWPRRAIVLLNGSAFNAEHYTIPVEGYDGVELAAREGLFAFSVDYIGVDESFTPANGLEASFEANLAAIERLVRYIRFFRLVPKVDLLGEGYGGALATQLAVDHRRIRSVSMSAMLYREALGGPLTDPAFVAFLQNSPNGYFPIDGAGALVFMDGAPQAAKDFVVATQTGIYPTLNFLVAAEGLPFFDPGVARVPGQVIWGPLDFITPLSEAAALAEDYGSNGAVLTVLDDAGHAPRTESPGNAARFWDAVFTFIDP